MFIIESATDGTVNVAGRLDASQSTAALAFLDGINGPCVLDMAALEYISSAGLGVLLKTQQRLKSRGQALKFVNVSRPVADVFKYSGFDRIFVIEVQA